jgi:hypothetical protein
MKENLVEAMRTGMDGAVSRLHKSKRGSCLATNCPNDSLAKGFCNAHYLRLRKGADMSTPVQAQTDACIDCGGALNSKGGWMRCAKHFKLVRQRTIKEALIDAMGGCCQKCNGVFSLAAYDFHHTGKKDGDPSHLIGNASIQKIAEEIEKCILLCANCHRTEHASEL